MNKRAELREWIYNLSNIDEKVAKITKKRIKVTSNIRGIPDGTGPYGRGMGPGQGKADGSGLKQNSKKLNKVPGVPDKTGPYGRGNGPGQGKADGSGMKKALKSMKIRKLKK